MSGKRVKKMAGKTKVIIALVVSVVLILAVCTGFFIYSFSGQATVMADNMYVNSLHIGGLTYDLAVEKIDAEYNMGYFDKTIEVKFKEKVYGLNLADRVKVDAEATAKEALKKSGNKFNQLFNKDKLVVEYAFTMDDKKAEADLLNFFASESSLENVFVFNDDYTSVKVDALAFESAVDGEKTIEKIKEGIKKEKFENLDAVVLTPDDQAFSKKLYKLLVRPAVDATVGINEDKTTYIVPQIVGIQADEGEFLKLYKENDGVFEMGVTPIHPEITIDDLDIEFYQDVLGAYTSAYNAGNVNRTKNLNLATKSVNGTILMPGEVFSYNRAVGKRTYDRGFVDATVYTNEGTEEGIGGGICQVSSTIYCAQLRANLKTVSRTNHSYTVAYVPLGQDATVVYGSLDYMFSNNTKYPVKIVAYANGGYLTVKIMGTKIDKSVTYDVVSVTNSTIPRGETTKESPEIPVGETRVEQNGQSGAVVSTYLVEYKDGKEVKRSYIGKSSYSPLNKIILVGTKPAEEGEEALEEAPDEGDADSEKPDDASGVKPDDAPTPDDTEIEPGGEEEPSTESGGFTEDFEIPTSDTGI